MVNCWPETCLRVTIWDSLEGVFAMKNLLASAAFAATTLGFAVLPASAGPTAMTVGSGWQIDVTDSENTASEGSPLTFTATSGSYAFSLTDGFLTGDVYDITLNGSLTPFVSTFASYPTPFNNNLGDSTDFAAAWLDDDYSHFELDFGPGTYSFVITDTSDVEYPAHFGYRLDALPTPEPFTLSLFGAGLAGAAAMRRRKKAKA
jgi:hypothetical protein